MKSATLAKDFCSCWKIRLFLSFQISH
uniref:Uncharacterized protein n=1 Tax=Arundo donax TaxID=35708 RepID=A0A0A9CFH0_ARUDO